MGTRIIDHSYAIQLVHEDFATVLSYVVTLKSSILYTMIGLGGYYMGAKPPDIGPTLITSQYGMDKNNYRVYNQLLI